MWRDLTPPEAATLPEARLGGALLAMFVFAVLSVVALIVAALVIAIAASARGGGDWFRGGPQMVAFLVPSVFIAVLAAVFAIMTLARARATPGVLSAGMIVWMVLRLLFTIGAQIAMAAQFGRSGNPMLLTSLMPALVSLAADAIAVAAVCGYMADGTRPNAYYLHRIRTGR
ncbi:MAG: hypothetical protein KIT36_20710 [Alphaproteobacteria bacterium]|nr:hypothetical protein [Alphaproteobacteria bacterium]